MFTGIVEGIGIVNKISKITKNRSAIEMTIDLGKQVKGLKIGLMFFFWTHAGAVVLLLGLGIAVLIGHIFPIFYGFRGGKGVATILGIVICILPLACSLSLLIFLAVFFSTRIVSLSAMLAGLSFPIILNVMLGNTNPILTGFSVIVALILIITHRKNIQRIIKKEESKITFFSAKDK